MSENNDILEFMIQCLLKNKIENEKTKKSSKNNSYMIDATKSSLLKRNIQYAIQQQFIHENLDNNYLKYEISNLNELLNY